MKTDICGYFLEPEKVEATVPGQIIHDIQCTPQGISGCV